MVKRLILVRCGTPYNTMKGIMADFALKNSRGYTKKFYFLIFFGVASDKFCKSMDFFKINLWTH